MVTGIILAGGESRRFGGEKGLAPLQGKALVDWCIAALRPICDDIILSANSSSYDDKGYSVVPDLHRGHGPMMGIFSALQASKTEHNLILSVDTPLVTTDLLRYIFERRGDALIAVPQSGERHYEPLIGYYNSAVLPVMLDFFDRNNYKLPDFFQHVPFRGIDLHAYPGYTPKMMLNINTRGDLDSLTPTC